MKKIILTILTFLFALLQMFAQNGDQLIDAFKKSYTLESEGYYKKAADELKRVYDPSSYELNLRLGWLEYNAGLFDESSAYYQKAIDLKPYSEEAKFGLINPKAALGKWDEVVNLYRNILEVNPMNTVANYRLGLIYYGRKEYRQAAEFFEKVINLYPFDHDSLLMLAWTDYYLGNNKDAKILFGKVLLYNPADESALKGLDMLK